MYLELTDKDNRGPLKEQDEQGVGDGRYESSWIWRASLGGGLQEGTDPPEEEVNETVCHKWMTCRARADRWKEESDLLQEEMRRIVAFLEWKSTWWGQKVGSRLGSVVAEIQNGIDSYARKQENVYRNLAVSLINQWLPHLFALKLNISWAKSYSSATQIAFPVKQPQDSSNSHGGSSSGGPSSLKTIPPNGRQDGILELTGIDNDSGDEDDYGDSVEAFGEFDHYDRETNDGIGIGFEYDDDYM